METEKKIKEILARRGEGEYDPNQQVVTFEGFTATEMNKDLEKMSKDELITISKGHIKKARSMKKPELLKALKAFIASNPGKILMGTEEALREGNNSDEGERVLAEVEENDEGGVDMDLDNQQVVGFEGFAATEKNKDLAVDNAASSSVDDANVANSCSIIECDDTHVNDLVWCGECELWFCKYLHGPHNNHSAQTHYKEGRIRKTAIAVVDEIIENASTADVCQIAGSKRKISDSNTSVQPSVRNYGDVKLQKAIKAVQDILAVPSKNQIEKLRSALDYTSYNITFLTLLAQEFGIDVSSVASQSRTSRVQFLEYLLSMLK
jgi:hypothetical protein